MIEKWNSAPSSGKTSENPENNRTERIKISQPTIEREIDQHIFRYGALPEDHPANKYVNELLEKFNKKTGVNFRVIVCPDDKSVNAAALPDGTILLSAGLLKKVGNEEALMGVIAHERVHAYRHHAEAGINAPSSSSIITGGLKAVSRNRAQEYEADLRGTLKDLDDVGISPLAYKGFLEEMHEQEENPGLIHGSSMNRALNIASAVHLVDLRSLSTGTTALPDGLADSFGEYGQYSRQHLLYRPRSLYFSKKELKEKYENRDRAIEDLSTKEIPLAINAVLTYVAGANAPKGKVDSKDKMALSSLVGKFKAQVLDQDSSEENKRLILPLCLALATDLSLVHTQKGHEDLIDLELDTPDSPDKWKAAISTLAEQMSNINLPYLKEKQFADSVSSFFHGMLSSSSNWDSLSEGARANLINECLDSWASLENSIDENFPGEVEHKKTSPNMKIEILIRNLPDKFHSALRLAIVKSEEKNQESLSMITESYELGEKFGQAKTKKEISTFMIEAKAEIAKLCEEKNPEEVAKTIADIYLGMQESSSEFLRDESGDPHMNISTAQIGNKDRELNFYIKLHNTEVSIAHLILYCAETLSAKGKISNLEEMLIRVTSLPDSSTLTVTRASLYEPHKSDFETYIEEKKDPEEMLSKAQEATTEDVILAAKYLTQHNAFRKIRIPYEGMGEVDMCDEIFCQYIVSWLAGNSFKENLTRISTLEAQGVNVWTNLRSYSHLAGPLCLSITGAIEAEESFEGIPLQDLLNVRYWIANSFLRAAFERHILALRWDQLSFEKKLDLCFPISGEEGISDVTLQEKFLEEEVKTKDDFGKVKERLARKIDIFTTEGSASAGVATILSNFNFQRLRSNTICEALLLQGESDKELKKTIYSILSGVPNIVEMDVARRTALAENIASSFGYLDRYGKQILLRALLTSKWGVLTDPGRKKDFLDFLVNHWVRRDPDQDNISAILQDVQKALSNEKDWQLLYFALQSALREKIAIPTPPQNTTSWMAIPEAVEDVIHERFDGGDYITDRKINKVLESNVWIDVPNEAKLSPHKHLDSYRAFSELKLHRALESTGTIEVDPLQRFSPLGMVKEVASCSGSVGVRFMQLLPQCIEMRKDQEEELSSVYDSIKGQSKLSALALLEREWPEMWDEIEEVGDRIGGGAAVTVYRALTKSGENIVLKVRNPNIEFHLEETFKFASNILSRLKSKGKGYGAAEGVLSDIREWIEGDIAFDEFLQKDRTFQDTHNGFRKPGFDYEILVPTSHGPESKFFSIEDEVEGQNLTQWEDLAAQGHDMKQVVSLLVGTTVNQIAAGLVHSDIHIGNFRVTPDKKVAILDRNFFLSPTPQEQELLFAILNPLEESSRREELLINYLNIPITTSTLKKSVAQVTEGMQEKDWSKAQSGLISLKQNGVKIPLTITLLIKNFNSLRLMAQKAGFKDLSETFAYST